MGQSHSKADVVCGDSSLNKFILEHMSVHKQGYTPSPWSYNAHFQIVRDILAERVLPAMTYDTETLMCSDGAKITLKWHVNEDVDSSPESTVPIVLLMHGVTGSHVGMGRVTQVIEQAGWRTLVYNRHGHDPHFPLTIPRFNTMGRTDELREVLRHVKSKFRRSPILGIGLSAGSGLLCRYLGEEGDNSLIDAGALISPGYDLRHCMGRFHPFYDKFVTKRIQDIFLHPYEELFKDVPGYAAALEAKCLQSLHDHLYGVAGFATKEEYIAASNPMGVVESITKPLIVFNAKDDPITVWQNCEEVIKSGIFSKDNAMLVVTDSGGHTTYCEGLSGGTSWAERCTLDYFTAVMRFQQQENPKSL
eukprot:GFYU01007286.1.p1 GENE.GFYU01007286.1~~GFYU01007286.1.p1  ORF type:complete len:362 (+),score=66.93 GFYU01007286.1:188-1273(+)